MIYSRLNEVKDSSAPILQLNVYNPSDCGQPGVEISSEELGVIIFNQWLDPNISLNGGFLVDIYTPFRGNACEYISGVDQTYTGYEVIAQKYRAVYESLPPEFVEPFEMAGPTP